MKSVNLLIKCFITYINNEGKTLRYSGFIINDQCITVLKHRLSNYRFTISLSVYVASSIYITHTLTCKRNFIIFRLLSACNDINHRAIA